MQIRIRDFDVYISFKYDTNLIKKIKEIPSKAWDPVEKEWWIPKIYLNQFLDSIRGVPYSIKEEVRYKDPDADERFYYVTEPFQHQLDCFEYAKHHDRFLLGDEQGLGKTKQTIDIAVYRKLSYGYKHCLILCGIKTLVYNWQEEIYTHSDEFCFILGARQRKNGNIIYGGTKEKMEDLIDIDEMPYFLITNVESIRSDKILSKLQELIARREIEMIIFDEFHKVKNIETVQGKALLKLDCHSKIACTGTPLMNSPLDLFVILKWLGIEKHDFYVYKKYYCILGDFKSVQGYKNLTELSLLLEAIMLRRKKEEVLDLPPKIETIEYLEMEKEQWEIYDEIRQAILDKVDKIDDISLTTALAEIVRLRQATGFTGILSETVRVSVKYDRAFDYVEEAYLNGKKVIIFSQWLKVLNPLYKAMEEAGYNPALITGEVQSQERKHQERKFQEDPTCTVILGTISAMGVGITLNKASVVLLLDEPWNEATKTQAVDRAHRIGTAGTVNVITFIARGTIDESVNELVSSKGMLSSAIVDGEIRGPRQSEIINLLLSK